MNNLVLGLIIAGAFVAGSLTTLPYADAKNPAIAALEAILFNITENNCAVGKAVTGFAADGTPICAANAGDSDTLGDLGCTDGEIAKVGNDGSTWECQPDDDTDSLRDLSCNQGEVPTWSGSAWECGSNVLSALGCTDGEFAVVSDDGSNWECQALDPPA